MSRNVEKGMSLCFLITQLERLNTTLNKTNVINVPLIGIFANHSFYFLTDYSRFFGFSS